MNTIKDCQLLFLTVNYFFGLTLARCQPIYHPLIISVNTQFNQLLLMGYFLANNINA